jgi:hypothetical protein
MNVFADNLFLNLTVGSKHLNTNQQFNESNPGVGITSEKIERKTVSYRTLGYYKNSINKTSIYIGGGMKRKIIGNSHFGIDVGFLGGIVSGYNSSIIPMGMLLMVIGSNKMKTTVGYIPRINEQIPAVLTFNVQVKL